MNAELLHAVDGFDLPHEYRVLLRPYEAETDFQGNVHRLPRFFYEIRSWQEAHDIRLAPHFTIVLLARFLEDFRREVDASVFISANGGYRSPAHQTGGAKSIHAWGTAANIYRIGDTWLSDAKSIQKFGSIAASLSPAVFVRPFGPQRGQTDDHLHIDLGFVSLTPREYSEAR